MKIHAYIYTYIHTYTHTYIHTYIHTHTHTYIHTYIHTAIAPFILLGRFAENKFYTNNDTQVVINQDFESNKFMLSFKLLIRFQFIYEE